MKVLFIANQFGHFRHMEPIASVLVERGHHVEFQFGNVDKKDITDRSVKEFINKHGISEYRRMLPTQDIWRPISRFFRSLLGYRVYLKPGWTSEWYKEHYLHRMTKMMLFLLKSPIVKKILLAERSTVILRAILRFIPSNRKAVRDLRNTLPDVLIVTTNLPWEAQELDYLKAAFSINIPSVLQVASWDNLTTKSTFNIIPDAILVWNEAIKEEAKTLHGVPEDSIIITGAATFDYLFTFRPKYTREGFCDNVGLISEKPFVVYLGSSTSIAGDETKFAREFVKQVHSRLGINVLIRPHPVNYKIWKNFNEAGCVVWPKTGELPDTADTKQDFLETLYHGMVVVGVNTSAMIESSVLDRPCIAIRSDQFISSQSEASHFRHLSNGQFLEIAEDINSAISHIKTILDGNDRLHEKRNAFVSDFIRPKGVNESVGSLIADILLNMGREGLLKTT